jgi:outer membrane murein-binding lipoprotein Lpp
MRKQLIGAVALCALLPLTGCATSGEVEKLDNRVSALEQRFGDVERRAAAAEATAQRASADAQAAAQNADRSEAMFKKSVTK